MNKKVSLDTNVLIDEPNVVFQSDRDFVISFTVIRELDNLKRNPDLKRSAQQALKNIWSLIKTDSIEILNIPKTLENSPDEQIINDTKGANASILTNDIGARLIARAFGVDVTDYEVESEVDFTYTGVCKVVGTPHYEQDFTSLKEMQLEEFNEQFSTKLKENQYCIIERVNGASDIWVNQRGRVTRVSQSMKPYKDAGVLITPMDPEQMCALDALFDTSVPLTVIDGKLGTGSDRA